MFRAIVILVVLIVIATFARRAHCCQSGAESMASISHGCRSRQLLTGSLANASLPEPTSIITYKDVIGDLIPVDGAMTAPALPAPALPAPTIPAPLMPLRTITYHKTAWCSKCALMEPVWNKLKSEVSGIVYVEVNEDISRTPGIMGVPTIIMRDPLGAVQYRGPPEYEHLKRWATAPIPYWQ